jgi:hypothetical protein
MERSGIDHNNAVFIRQFVKAREALNVVGILVHPVQNDDYGIVLLWVVPSRQTQDVVSVHIVDDYLFLSLLRTRRRAK